MVLEEEKAAKVAVDMAPKVVEAPVEDAPKVVK